MAKDSEGASRRGLLRAGGLTAAGLALGAAGAPGYPAPTETDLGGVQDGRVRFPNWRGEAEPPPPPAPNPLPPGERVGYAIIGLGRISVEETLPAFGEAKMARPVALVTGSPEKGRAVARRYGIPESAVHSYQDLEKLRDNPAVQAVYIGLPNAMHREYTERSAGIGKHVLCEKPMATSPEDAAAMVAACARARVRLMIAYRCQYEPFNREAIRIARSGELGKLRSIEATNVQSSGTVDQWRFDRALAGGGALPDIGLYCLNATRYITGEEPNDVFARIYSPPGDQRWKEIEESVSFMLRFPSGVIANCLSSYDSFNDKSMTLHFEKGTVEMPDAFSYHGQQMYVSRREGGVAVREQKRIEPKNQFALELDHFAMCVKENRQPHTPGEEGAHDQALMAAIYRSAAEGRPVDLPKPPGPTRGPEPAQAG
ncbi:Gfo/Idh/MocA family protein [Roseomonas populi]|uniref:Gfo/Idh/MocA family oxidoreductase n=1 Tax=Roseomonas populi TaxID=3121582 RepID=A0ABT1WZC5_9PROT|nr:Gfo/Idh/MocA family oxidoreductase [Roseomonas pecuniae]MCR0980814.1 Gfo/Idh/MocA family oxidoreductase [Roseomonas pecuniae]